MGYTRNVKLYYDNIIQNINYISNCISNLDYKLYNLKYKFLL